MEGTKQVRRFLLSSLFVIPLGAICCFFGILMVPASGNRAESMVNWGVLLVGLGLITLGAVSIFKFGFAKEQPLVQPITPISTQKTDHFQRLQTIAEIRQLTPVEFEIFIKRLFEKMEYEVETTKVTGDEGVDLRLQKGARRAIVQCKRYSGSVGQPAIRDLYGVMVHEEADEAYLITTGNITLPAQTWAQGKPIHLVDSVQLLEWIKELNLSTSILTPNEK